MTKHPLPTWPFFLLPVAMLSGTALQGGGLYLLGILIPAYLYREELALYSRRLPLITIGVALVCLYFIFPAFDGLQFLIFKRGMQHQGVHPSWHEILRGPLSTGVGMVGIFLTLFGLYHRLRADYGGSGAEGHETSPTILNAFSRGLCFASAILLAYVTLQWATGFDYRPLVAYRSDRQLPSGFFRASGFFTHPLSLAGVSLAILAFCWSLFWQNIERRIPEIDLPGKEALFLSLTHLALIFMTGSRGATAIALVILTIVPLAGSAQNPQLRRLKLICVATVVVLGGLGLFLSDQKARFQELLQQLGTNQGDHRLDFWSVHWRMFLDAPIFGHGHAWLQAFGRRSYYEVLGFAQLPQKFNAHNIFLEILVDVGVFGAAILALTLLVLFKTLRGIGRCEPVGTALISALGIAFAANMVHGLIQNTFFDTNITFTYLILLLVLLWSLVDHRPYAGRRSALMS